MRATRRTSEPAGTGTVVVGSNGSSLVTPHVAADHDAQAIRLSAE